MLVWRSERRRDGENEHGDDCLLGECSCGQSGEEEGGDLNHFDWIDWWEVIW